jgi:hypothetical protein
VKPLHPVHRLLRLIAGTAETEISCTECFGLLPQYADLEQAGRPAATVFPQLVQHLQQCAACREEYEVLRDLLHADDTRPPASDTT